MFRKTYSSIEKHIWAIFREGDLMNSGFNGYTSSINRLISRPNDFGNSGYSFDKKAPEASNSLGTGSPLSSGYPTRPSLNVPNYSSLPPAPIPSTVLPERSKISQTGFGNFNFAVGDDITQAGKGSLFVGLGFKGNDSFSIQGDNNISTQRGTTGGNVFSVDGQNGFYKVNGGRGNNTLKLNGSQTDWTMTDRNIFYNSKTNTTVFAYGISDVVYG
jgi:hypothetical protein